MAISVDVDPVTIATGLPVPDATLDKYWTGGAHAVQQVVTITVGGTLAGETFTISCGGEVIASHTDATTTIADTVAALVAAWDASTNPYAVAVDAADSSPTLTLTAETTGVPFEVTLNTPGGSATFAQSATTANAGPSVWGTPRNWSGNVIPTDGDRVYVGNLSHNIAYDLDQSSLRLRALVVNQAFAKRIGLDRLNFATSADGETVSDTQKPEYRETYLKIGAKLVEIGARYGPASSASFDRLKIDNRATGTKTEVYSVVDSSAEAGLPVVRLLFADSTGKLYVRTATGGVGVAVDGPDEESTLQGISVGRAASGTSTHVVTGEGLTLSNYRQDGGTGVLRANGTVATIEVDAGTLQMDGEFACTLLTVDGGSAYPNNYTTDGSNAIGTIDLNGGVVDGDYSNRSRTWGTVNQDVTSAANTTLTYDNDVVTVTTLNEERT